MKYKQADQYEISDGNLKVLELIPRLMKNYKYRHKLRAIVLDYLSEEKLHD